MQLKIHQRCSTMPQLKFKQMGQEYVESCMKLILRNFYNHHFIFKLLKPEQEDLISYYIPILADQTLWKYSLVILDENNGEVVAMALQKDLYDETLAEDRVMHENPIIRFKQNLYWEMLDYGLMEKSQDCRLFKIDQESDLVLGNIGSQVIMSQIMSVVDESYSQFNLEKMLQIMGEKRAMDSGFIFGITQCSNQQTNPIGQQLQCDMSYKVDLTQIDFEGIQVFQEYSQDKYVYTTTTCYKNPIRRQLMNQISAAQPKL